MHDTLSELTAAMMTTRSRIVFVSFTFLAFLGSNATSRMAAAEGPGQGLETLNVQRGNLSVLFRDNSHSPKILSGLDSLFQVKDAPDFDAFDPDDLGASAGLNFA